MCDDYLDLIDACNPMPNLGRNEQQKFVHHMSKILKYTLAFLALVQGSKEVSFFEAYIDANLKYTYLRFLLQI